MSIIAEICTIYAILISLLFIGFAVIGVYNFVDEYRRRQLIYDSDSTLRSEATHIGISVVISGLDDSPWALERWMSLDYSRYEVILVCDFRRYPKAKQVVEKYSMIEVEHATSGEMPCYAPRAVYRSRERRYKPLVVVDRDSTTLTDDFNCGVLLCRHQYVVSLNRWTMLHNDALNRLALELHEAVNREIYAVGAFRSAVLPHCKVETIDYLVRMMTLGAGLGSISGMGYYMGGVVMFEREAVVTAGGYADNFLPDIDLLERIQTKLNRSSQQSGVIFSPQILAHESGTNSLVCGSVPTRMTPTGVSFASRRSVTTFFWLLLLLAIASLFMGDHFSMLAFMLIIIVSYTATVSVAAVSLIPGRIILADSAFNGRMRSIWRWLPLYPFFLLRCLMCTKNFVKS